MNDKRTNEDASPEYLVDIRTDIGIAELGTASETTRAMVVWGLFDGATVWPFIAEINPYR